MYNIQFTRQAAKDAIKAERAGLKPKAAVLLRILRENPYQNPPEYEKLAGDMAGSYSRRMSRQHRMVYEVLPNTENLKDENDAPYQGIVKIIRLWTHYE